MRPSRRIRSAIVLKPSTLLHLHQVLTKRKYRLFFSPQGRSKPGPKARPKNAWMRLSPLSNAIPSGAVRESLSRLPGPSASPSIKMSCGVSWPGQALPTQAGRQRAVLADFPRSPEGPSLERRPLSLRIGRVADSRDTGRQGSVPSSDYGVWPARRRGPWDGPLPNAQPRPVRPPLHAEAPQFRPRCA